MTLTLSCTYNALAEKRLFADWHPRAVAAFCILMVFTSILVDLAGIGAGYWIYPHYGKSDQVRKYIFEWGVALFYHFLALQIGVEILRRVGIRGLSGLLLSLLLFVTLIGFITESLNLKVYSWKVLAMPLSDYRVGDYFVVFQTVGYWLMAAIPYVIYRWTEAVFVHQRIGQRFRGREGDR
jgi:hypothetical protein